MIKRITAVVFTFLCICTICAQTAVKPAASANGEKSLKGDAAEVEYSGSVKLKLYRWSISNAIVLQDHTGNSRRSATRNPLTELWFKKKDGNWNRIVIPAGGITNEFEFDGGLNLDLYVRVRKQKKDEEDFYRKVGSMPIPAGVNSLFVLMIQRGENARFFPMNVSPKVLPKNKVAVLNMTAQRIGLSMGEQNSMLNAGAYTIYSPNKKDDESCEFKVFKFDQNRWRPVYEGNIMTVTDKRCMLLVYDPYGRRDYPKFSVQQVYF